MLGMLCLLGFDIFGDQALLYFVNGNIITKNRMLYRECYFFPKTIAILEQYENNETLLLGVRTIIH